MQVDLVAEIQRELAQRCAKNPSYSLRSFAKTLGTSPALLSLVLNRRRPISMKFQKKLADVLGITAEASKLPSLDTISLRDLEMSQSPLSYAVLSLIETFDFKSDVNWIAKRLNVSVHEVKSVLSSMEDSGLIETSTKVWKALTAPVRISNKLSSAFTRRFQAELIAKALKSLEDDSIQVRDHSSITFAVNIDDLPEIKKEIRKFRLALSEKYESKKKLTEVYNLTVQLTPVTKR
ncbi:MAG: TIGR02147 family protein [Proteobacteria bacterium]|nr:MAG: TIGR02147 family protein [Pseudomonadota bacterium]